MTEVKVFTYCYVDDQRTQLRYPYLGGEVLNVGAESVTTKPETAANHTAVVRLQIEPGKSVCIEVTPENHETRPATQASPTITGDVLIPIGKGWTVSVVEWAAPAVEVKAKAAKVPA